MAEKPRTLRLTNLWDNTKKFNVKNASHEQVKTIYKNLWKEHLSKATEAGVDRATAWKAFQKEKGILLVADQTGEYGAARAFKARFTDNFQYTTETSVTAQSRQWFDDFLSQATDGTPFTTTDGRNLYLHEFDQQYKELHHIHGISEGGVVAKPSIIAYINGDTARAQAEFRTASHVWRKQGLILGSKVENMQALTNYQHLGKDVGGHAQVGKQFRDTAIQEGKGKNKRIINAPQVIEEGAKEVKGRTLVTGSGESGLKFMPEMLNKVQTLPGDTLKYTTPKLVDGQMKSVYKGPFSIDPDVYTRFHAYGDIVILTDEGRKDRLFNVMLPDSPAVKPGTLKAEVNPKKVKAQQNKLNLLLKKGIITEDQYKQMEGVSNLVRRLDTELVTDADILRAKKYEQGILKGLFDDMAGSSSGKLGRQLFGNVLMPVVAMKIIEEDLKQRAQASVENPLDIGAHTKTALGGIEWLAEGSQMVGSGFAGDVVSTLAGVLPLVPVAWRNREALGKLETYKDAAVSLGQTGSYLWDNRGQVAKEVGGYVVDQITGMGEVSEAEMNEFTRIREESLKKENSWQTNRSLGVNDNKSNEEAAQIPTESTGVLNQREGTEDTEEEFKVGVSNFN